jgi:hypothetical protein
MPLRKCAFSHGVRGNEIADTALGDNGDRSVERPHLRSAFQLPIRRFSCVPDACPRSGWSSEEIALFAHSPLEVGKVELPQPGHHPPQTCALWPCNYVPVALAALTKIHASGTNFNVDCSLCAATFLGLSRISCTQQ